MDEKSNSLKKLRDRVNNDQSLPLREDATNLVFGEGDINSKIYIIGEAPGRNEDLEGRPFVGRAGKLLEKVLLENGISRESVFISNMVYFRPPENRLPTPGEIDTFSKYVNEQIKIIDPKIIVTLGRTPLSKFLPREKITEIHGRVKDIEFNNKKIKLIPMFHPAAALRSTQVKKLFERDFKTLSSLISA